MLTYFLIYLAASYLIGTIWFLFLERKDGLLKWRLMATAGAPLAVPICTALFLSLGVLEKIFTKKVRHIDG